MTTREPATPTTTATTFELAFRSPASFLVAYATQLSKGSLFVETPEDASPPAAGTQLALRLTAPPGVAVTVPGVVAWARVASAARQPAGISVALPALPDALAAAVDGLAFGFRGVDVVLRTGEAAPRAILTRYLRSILTTCEVIDGGGELDDAALGRADLAVIDLDSCGQSGWELAGRLRAHARAASAPIVGLAQLERERARAARAGFDEAVANPPAFAELEAAVLRALARPLIRAQQM